MNKCHKKFRNPVACSPLLRKGGPHTKSKTGQRVKTRLLTQTLIDDWFDEINDNKNMEQQNGEQKLPDFLPVKQIYWTGTPQLNLQA